jgi:hypothetical protein
LRRVLLLVVLILTLTASNCIGTGGKTVVRGGSKFADDVEYLTGRLGSSADDVRRTLNETASRSGESPEALASRWRAEPPPSGVVGTFGDDLRQVADANGIGRDALKAAVCEAAAKLLIEDKQPTVNDVEVAIRNSLLQRLPLGIGRALKAQEAAKDARKAIFGTNTNYQFDYATDLHLTILKIKYCS